MRRIILIVIAVAAVVGVSIGVYLWNKPHKNMEQAQVDMAISAIELMADFNEDEEAANAKYLDKVIAVKGTVMSVNESNGAITVSLETNDDLGAVACELDNLTAQARTSFEPGEEVTFKGVCTGKLIDVVLVRCVPVE